MKHIALALAFLALPACAQAQTTEPQTFPDSAFIYWSDGDSGYIRGIPEPIHFRIHDMDTPETGGVGARGGAKCEPERALGYEAKEYAVALADGAEITITGTYGDDRYDRRVIDLSLDGQDYASAIIDAGHGKVWDYDGGQPKPEWCG